MPAQKKRHHSGKLLAVTVLAMLALLSIVNCKMILKPLLSFVQHDLVFEEFIDEVQKGYISDNFVCKNDFVNLNGLFARLTGRRTLNDVVRLNNGMLGWAMQDVDMTAMANGITGLSEYLNELNIPLLYVQIPFKEALDGQTYPVGITSYANKNADNLLFQLSAGGVESLDLRPLLAQTPEMLEQYFAKTDHHWNNDGSFAAFQEILGCLHELFPEGNIDLTYAQADQWERHAINDWFLGSLGKRVGIFFGGTDPLIWYTPKFETEMSCTIPKYEWFVRGDFSEANIRTLYIEEKDYFKYNAYCVYIGGDYPLVQHRNLNAPSPLKVLMIRDSFTTPLQTYLSTAFQEVDTIDPRYFFTCSVAEYVEWTRPDVVIFAINPSVFTLEEYKHFGVEQIPPVKTENGFYDIVTQQDMEVEASDNDRNYMAYPLEANTLYRVTFEKVDILEGDTEGIVLHLYDRTIEAALENAIFDLTYCEATNGFSWTFRTPDIQDELQLLFYAGIYGATAGNGLIYRNVTLEKLGSVTHFDNHGSI